jgi:hypothetical protein
MRSSIACFVLALSAASVAAAQDDRYLLLATERTGTMQKEIDDAAAKGFRVVTASPGDGGEYIVLLEQTTDKYQYRLLATTRTGTLQRELDEAAKEGYRILPKSIAHKGDELLVLMEKGAENSAPADYQVLATERTGTLQKEISQASVNGYTLIALAKRGEHVAILERETR